MDSLGFRLFDSLEHKQKFCNRVQCTTIKQHKEWTKFKHGIKTISAGVRIRENHKKAAAFLLAWQALAPVTDSKVEHLATDPDPEAVESFLKQL